MSKVHTEQKALVSRLITLRFLLLHVHLPLQGGFFSQGWVTFWDSYPWLHCKVSSPFGISPKEDTALRRWLNLLFNLTKLWILYSVLWLVGQKWVWKSKMVSIIIQPYPQWPTAKHPFWIAIKHKMYAKMQSCKLVGFMYIPARTTNLHDAFMACNDSK